MIDPCLASFRKEGPHATLHNVFIDSAVIPPQSAAAETMLAVLHADVTLLGHVLGPDTPGLGFSAAPNYFHKLQCSTCVDHRASWAALPAASLHIREMDLRLGLHQPGDQVGLKIAVRGPRLQLDPTLAPSFHGGEALQDTTRAEEWVSSHSTTPPVPQRQVQETVYHDRVPPVEDKVVYTSTLNLLQPSSLSPIWKFPPTASFGGALQSHRRLPWDRNAIHTGPHGVVRRHCGILPPLHHELNPTAMGPQNAQHTCPGPARDLNTVPTTHFVHPNLFTAVHVDQRISQEALSLLRPTAALATGLLHGRRCL